MLIKDGAFLADMQIPQEKPILQGIFILRSSAVSAAIGCILIMNLYSIELVVVECRFVDDLLQAHQADLDQRPGALPLIIVTSHRLRIPLYPK